VSDDINIVNDFEIIQSSSVDLFSLL
jgi:hypothetical protein